MRSKVINFLSSQNMREKRTSRPNRRPKAESPKKTMHCVGGIVYFILGGGFIKHFFEIFSPKLGVSRSQLTSIFSKKNGLKQGYCKLQVLGGIKQYKCMVILRDFPCNNALFGFVKKMTFVKPPTTWMSQEVRKRLRRL